MIKAIHCCLIFRNVGTAFNTEYNMAFCFVIFTHLCINRDINTLSGSRFYGPNSLLCLWLDHFLLYRDLWYVLFGAVADQVHKKTKQIYFLSYVLYLKIKFPIIQFQQLTPNSVRMMHSSILICTQTWPWVAMSTLYSN